jgi:very-short-patch-repair endonuclease/predicted transcriptional regulator of viral defense system
VDQAIAEIATRQHGVIEHDQLVALGLGRGAIRHRLANGRLHRRYRRVYTVGHCANAMWTSFMAAVLACGPGALLSHRDAAELWGLLRHASSKIHVTVPGRARHGSAGIVIHRPRSLHPEDRAVCEGIPVTSVARTLLDLAAVVPFRQLVRTVEQAERLELFDLRAVESLLARSHGRAGVRALRAAIPEAARDVVHWTASDLEREFLGLCREAALPEPAVNLWVEGFEVDAVWPAQKLVVELDSWEYHRTRAAFERDRQRDSALQLAGYRVIRVTQRRIERETADLVSELRALLGV